MTANCGCDHTEWGMPESEAHAVFKVSWSEGPDDSNIMMMNAHIHNMELNLLCQTLASALVGVMEAAIREQKPEGVPGLIAEGLIPVIARIHAKQYVDTVSDENNFHIGKVPDDISELLGE